MKPVSFAYMHVKILFRFRVDDQFDFDLLVKTDDDCYLNIPSILKVINTLQFVKFMY